MHGMVRSIAFVMTCRPSVFYSTCCERAYFKHNTKCLVKTELRVLVVRKIPVPVENGSKTLEGGDGSSLCEPSSGKRPEIGTGDVRAASERAALMGDGSAAGGDPRGSAIGASVGGTCSMPEEVGGCAAHQRSAEQIVNPNPRSDSKTPDLEDQTTLSRSSSTAATDSRNSLRNVAGDDQVDSTGSSPFHIPGETDEFHMLCKEIVTTPRKMKRILNM